MTNTNNIPLAEGSVLPEVTVFSTKSSISKKFTIATTIIIVLVVATISKIFK